jgi:hypothetical protein
VTIKVTPGLTEQLQLIRRSIQQEATSPDLHGLRGLSQRIELQQYLIGMGGPVPIVLLLLQRVQRDRIAKQEQPEQQADGQYHLALQGLVGQP